MKTSDFYYDLPKELIAQDPLEDRSASRLMHLNKETGEYEHGHFRDILKYLKRREALRSSSGCGQNCGHRSCAPRADPCPHP